MPELKVSRVFQLPPGRMTEGDVGIEIEVEGDNLPSRLKHWRVDHDGSLHGRGLEYVLNEPMSLKGARMALDSLDKVFKRKGSEVIEGVRAGVHVHVNVQTMNIVQLYNFMTLYLILEEPLVNICGKKRQGNLFCLRSVDADYLIYCLRRAAQTRRFDVLSSDDLRYASMNVKSLWQYGSLEFRAMRSTRDLDKIYEWTQLLVNLRDAAMNFEDPVDIVSSFSGGPVYNFVEQVLGGNYKLLQGVNNIEEKLNRGVRMSQDVAFATNWDELKNYKPKNPFGGGLAGAILQDVGPAGIDDIVG